MVLAALKRNSEKCLENQTERSHNLDIPTEFKEFAPLCRIKSGSKIIPFKLYDYQELLSDLLDKHPKAVIYKTRQLGISEEIICKMLHRSMLNIAYSGVALSIGQDESSKLAARVKGMPRFDGFEWEYQGTQHLRGGGCGDLFFKPSTDNSGRSLSSVTDILFDEAGFIKKFDAIYAAATPAQEMAGDNAGTYLVSTMPEAGGLTSWWKMFRSSCPGNIELEHELERVRNGNGRQLPGFTYWIDTAGWLKVLVHWHSHPIYSLNPNYLADTKDKRKLTDAQLDREFDLKTPSSTGSLFNLKKVAEQAKGNWELSPKVQNKYMVGIDPNFGGDDFYCLLVLDISTPIAKVVYQYRQNKKTNPYNQGKALEIIDRWKPVLVAIEGNSGGIVLLENLVVLRPGLRVEKVTTSKSSKRVNCERVALKIEHQELEYPSDWEFCSESTRTKNGKATTFPSEASQFLESTLEAFEGNDDTIMALAASMAWIDEARKLSKLQHRTYIPPEKDSPRQLAKIFR